MATTLILYITSNIFALGFQQYAFMQFVRDETPFGRVFWVTKTAIGFFVLTALLGLYYYATYYELYEMAGVLGGEYAWVHTLLVETKWIVLILAPIFSVIFLLLAQRVSKSESQKLKTKALFFALITLGLGALNIGTEILIGGAAF